MWAWVYVNLIQVYGLVWGQSWGFVHYGKGGGGGGGGGGVGVGGGGGGGGGYVLVVSDWVAW